MLTRVCLETLYPRALPGHVSAIVDRGAAVLARHGIAGESFWPTRSRQ